MLRDTDDMVRDMVAAIVAQMELDAEQPRLEMTKVTVNLVQHVEELAQERHG